MTTDKIDLLSTIVPVYNEEESLRDFTAALMPVLQELGTPFEVIFVNDGSSDNSAEILEDMASTNASIMSASHQHAGHAARAAEAEQADDAEDERNVEERAVTLLIVTHCRRPHRTAF